MKTLLLLPSWHRGAALKETVMWKIGTLGSTHGCATISTFDLVILSQMKTTNDHEKLIK